MEVIQSNKTGNMVQNVHGRLAADGEIQVKVPDTFSDFYKKKEKYKHSFTTDGWFCSNVIGKYTDDKLVIKGEKEAERDNLNAENTIATDIKMLIEGKCHYILISIIVGAADEFPVAIIFPDNQLKHPDYDVSPMDGCFCPRDMNELNKCLTGCMDEANCSIGKKFAKIKSFLIVDMVAT